jgi:pimeloyl-ACP methyl ester carboxylesterase
VAGHDRGARVAYRLALDHPDRVTRAVVLDVVPTVDQFERMGAAASLGYWPWYLLAATVCSCPVASVVTGRRVLHSSGRPAPSPRWSPGVACSDDHAFMPPSTRRITPFT